MKNIALAGLFAAFVANGLAGQNETGSGEGAKAKQGPLEVSAAVKMELASVTAVEEQQKDYKKALELYEAAIKDQKLSDNARRYAAYRLAALLRRLGRAEQAKAILKAAGKGLVVSLDDVTNEGQDPERQKQLRLQARKILKDLLANKFNYGQNGGAVSPDWLDQLTWIGAPAVPEVVTALQADLAGKGEIVRMGLGQTLYTWLWRQGGPHASKHLAQVATTSHGETAQMSAARMSYDLEAPEVRAYLELDDANRAARFVDRIEPKLTVAQLLTVADGGRSPVKARVLQRLARRDLNAEQLKKALAFCEEGRKGPNPELGKAAEQFLTSSEAQQSMEGLLMLISILPQLHERHVPIGSYQKTPRGPNYQFKPRRFSAEEMATLLPPMRAAIQRIGPVKGNHGPTSWFVSMVSAFMASGSEDAVRLGLEMWDLGYGVYYVFGGHATPDTAVELLKRWDKMPQENRNRFWWAFDENDMTPAAFPVLRQIAAKVTDSKHVDNVFRMIGRTGHPDAADWLAAEWRKGAIEGNSKRDNKHYVNALVEIGRTDKSESVRIAMRNMVRGFGGPKLKIEERARLMLALMSMADERTLDFITVGLYAGDATHPYADNDRRYEQMPLHYLASGRPHPAHGYTAAQITDTFKRLLAYEKRRVITTRAVYPGSVRDDVMVILANGEKYQRDGKCWQKSLVNRLNQRLRDGQEAPELEACFLAALGRKDEAGRWLERGNAEVVKRYRAAIRKLLDGDDDSWASYAINRLGEVAADLDLAELLSNRNVSVRQYALERIRNGAVKVPAARVMPLLRDTSAGIRNMAAQHLGAVVEKTAVPALIELLRDGDHMVRKSAADALTSIRFYHEQQAHWDRVLKGLDASPASAAEKLLVQAKPEAKKEQRLMAIKSLGVLGVPEALPFLIEWTGDKDKDISAAARAAITEIHLKPRK